MEEKGHRSVIFVGLLKLFLLSGDLSLVKWWACGGVFVAQSPQVGATRERVCSVMPSCTPSTVVRGKKKNKLAPLKVLRVKNFQVRDSGWKNLVMRAHSRLLLAREANFS